MRSKIGEPGVLSVAKDCGDGSEKSDVLFEVEASAGSFCVPWELREIAANLG